jgi:glutamyl-Q tRNA(Asp) synthetase
MALETRKNRSNHTIALAARLQSALPQHGWRTRFAPAPTGFLHLGHVVNALHVWGIARAHGGTVHLRIEDHDSTRARAEFETALLADLDWLGLAPDSLSTDDFRNGVSHFRQSDNLARYEEVLRSWDASTYTYACRCTRSEIARAQHHHSGDELRYPGTCANAHIDSTTTPARRARMANSTEVFEDLALGPQSQNPHTQCGDVLVRDRNGNFTYQLAVVVDDFDQGVDVIIRGQDLLPSTGRQFQIARHLGRVASPLVLHHALIMREDGIKLSKSLGDAGVRELRAEGVTPSEVLGRAAFAAGLLNSAQPLHANELHELFAP